MVIPPVVASATATGVERAYAGHPIFQEVRECSLFRLQWVVGPVGEEDCRLYAPLKGVGRGRDGSLI